jgi:hypothetical protein
MRTIDEAKAASDRRVERAKGVLRAHSDRRLEDNARRVMEEEQAKKDRREVIVEPVQRGSMMRWPFPFMRVGQRLLLENVDIKKAMSAAHACGKRYRWQFRCRRQPDGRSVEVERMPDDYKLVKPERQARQRLSWPFKDMRVGERVTIGVGGGLPVAKTAMAAHTYGAATGKKFRCFRTYDVRGDAMTVVRVG